MCNVFSPVKCCETFSIFNLYPIVVAQYVVYIKCDDSSSHVCTYSEMLMSTLVLAAVKTFKNAIYDTVTHICMMWKVVMSFVTFLFLFEWMENIVAASWQSRIEKPENSNEIDKINSALNALHNATEIQMPCVRN